MRDCSVHVAVLCRAQHLDKLDQGQMMAIRDDWFQQSKGAPPGNKCESRAVVCVWKPTKVLVIPAMHCKVNPCSPCMLNSVHAAPARVPQDSVTATHVRLQPLRMPGGISVLARAALLAHLTRACSPGSIGKTSTVEYAVEIADRGY